MIILIISVIQFHFLLNSSEHSKQLIGKVSHVLTISINRRLRSNKNENASCIICVYNCSNHISPKSISCFALFVFAFKLIQAERQLLKGNNSYIPELLIMHYIARMR